MFKKIIFITLIFTGLQSAAQIEKQILKQIEKTNSKRLGVTQPENNCIDCLPSEKSAKLFDACLKVLCEDKGLKNYSNIPAPVTETQTNPAEGEKEIEELYHKLHAISDSGVSLEPVKEAIRKGDVKISPENMRFAFEFLVLQAGTNSTKLNTSTYNLEFDETKYNSLKIPLSEKNEKLFKKSVENFVKKLPNLKKTMTMQEDNPDTFFATNYPFLSKEESVKKMVADFKNLYDKLASSHFGKTMGQITDLSSVFPRDIVDDIEAGRDVSDMALRELISQYNNFSSIITFFNAASIEEEAKNIDVEDLHKKLLDPNLRENALANEKKERENRKLKNEDERAACVSTYRRNMTILPSDQQINDLKNEIETVKKQIQSTWSPHYSSGTQKKIAEYMQKVTFATPFSKNAYREGAKKRLEREIQHRQRQSQLKINDKDTLATLFLAMEFAKKAQPASESDSGSDDFVCEKDQFNPLSDANATLQGKIMVSYTVAQSLDMGRGILAHELGHGVSMLFETRSVSEESAGKHKKFLACLEGLTGKAQYVEEGYADWVAANVSTANKACLYPQKLNMQKSALENEYEGDTHSGNFFRLLHVEAIQSRELPESCNQLLVEQKTPKDFLACQKLLN